MNANRNTNTQKNNNETNEDTRLLRSPRAQKLIAGVVGAGLLLTAGKLISDDGPSTSHNYVCGSMSDEVTLAPGGSIRSVLSEIDGALLPNSEVPVGERAENQPGALATRAAIAKANLPEIYNTSDIRSELSDMMVEFAEVENDVSQEPLDDEVRRLTNLEREYVHPNRPIQIPASVCSPLTVVEK